MKPKLPEKYQAYVESELRELIPDFMTRRKEEVVVLREALSKEDYKSIAALSHRVKGTAGSYGFKELSIFAGEIESIAPHANATRIKELIDLWEKYVYEVEIVWSDDK